MFKRSISTIASLGLLACGSLLSQKIEAQSIDQYNEFWVEVDDRTKHHIGGDTTHFFFMGYNPSECSFNTTHSIKFWYVKNGVKMHDGEFYLSLYQYSMPGFFQGYKQWQWVGKPWELARSSMPPAQEWMPCEIHFKYNKTSVITYRKDGIWGSNADTRYSGVWIKTLLQ